MSDRTIDQATRDTTVTGIELVPVSDGGAAKAVSVEQIKDYVVSAIAGASAADSADLDADGIYLLKNGAIKKLTAKTLAQEVLDYGFGLAGVVEIDGNEIVGVKDANVKKTITVEGLANYIQGRIGELTLNIESLNAADAAGGADLFVVSQSGTEKKISFTNIRKFALDGLNAYASETDSIGDNDYVYIYAGSSVKKIKRSSFCGNGDVTGPSETTEGTVAVWGPGTKNLGGGMEVVSSVDSSSTSSQIASAVSVYSATVGSVKIDDSTTEGKIPQWSSTDKKLTDGKSVVTEIRSSGTASDSAIPTEKAVRDAIVTPSVFSTGNNGLVPAPTSSDTSKYLCGDGTWKAVSGGSSSVGDFTGATSSAAGVHGLVPKPLAGDNGKFLRGDGTWATVSGGGSGATSYYDTMYIPAGVMTPSNTNGAETDTVSLGSGSTTKTNDVVVFAGGSTEYVEFGFDIPDDFDATGGMKIKLLWSSNSSSAELDSTVTFKVGSTLADDGDSIGPDPFSSSWKSATDTLEGTGTLHVTEAVDVSPLGFSGTYLRVIISRDATDTLSGSALLLGAKLQYKRTMQGEAW